MGAESESEIVWGAAAIGRVIGKTTRATFHLLENGQLPARQVGRQWAADRAKLRAFFRGEDEGSVQ